MSGVLRMYATSDTDLWQLYTDKTSTINWEIQTALWSLSDPIRDKQALKFGVEATITGALEAQLNITVDAENRSSAATTLSNAVIWVNNNGYTIPWTNNSGNQIAWVPTGYQLYKYDAQQYGKYLGLTVTSSAPSSTINGFQLEHELRARF